MTYCSLIPQFQGERKQLHQGYHDQFYGFTVDDDDELFCRLVLEINQAGLSWETVLKKQGGFRKAYSGFKVKKVAAYTEADRARLMGDPGIIRNRLKINAAIENAKAILLLQKEHGSFRAWLASEHPKSKDEWVKLFKRTFRFTGGEIVNEFLMSVGILPGAHEKTCPIYAKALKSKPLWSAQPRPRS